MKKIVLLILGILILMCFVSCDLLIPQDPTPEHIHSFGEWFVSKNASCTEAGIMVRYCDCGEKQSVNIPNLNHNPVVDKAIAPTCTEVGKTEGKHCSTCGLVLVQQDVIPTISHNYNYNKCSMCGIAYDAGCAHKEIQILPGYEATCTEAGRTEGKNCANCGAVIVRQYTISTVDHLYMEEYNSDELYHWYECKTCGAKKGNQEHQVGEDGTCTTCGQIDCATRGIHYRISSDGTYAIASNYEGTATNVKIADTYKGLPVKEIHDWTFYQCYTVTSVIIPDSVTIINEHAFRECTSLTSVTMGNSVTTIGEYAFFGCTNLETIILPDSVISIGFMAFRNCTKLTSIVIPDSVTTIANYAFSNCPQLASVVIGNGVTYIGDSAFYECSNLKSIIIPDSVTHIGESAFYKCSRITSVIIGDGVTYIGSFAFANCYSLNYLVISNGVTYIDNQAFYECTLLRNVYYTGSAEQWAAITINSYNFYPTNATIYFNYIPEN